MSLVSDEKEIEHYTAPKRVVVDSAASRNSDVGMALSLLASTGTSTKDFFRVSNHVPPAGKETFDGTAMIGKWKRANGWYEEER